jgi:3-mercaptopyruvate sulfurtransferase SseA/class 3 adenylate cyclase
MYHSGDLTRPHGDVRPPAREPVHAHEPLLTRAEPSVASARTWPDSQGRRVVTLLFCDISGSTSLGEKLDSESVREMLSNYFHEMRGAIERHGGTVEKFVGDAVMAVFGIPATHEDDALRAVRAAFEMQRRVRDLNGALEARYGSRIALRIGVNTGEVTFSDREAAETMVTGDAVNVTARLEQQAASTGEVLLGEQTFGLVRDAVEVEQAEPLALKGKPRPVPTYRLLAVKGQAAPARRVRRGALIGRAAELELLRRTFSLVCSERRCRLVVLTGEPGVGKSRLVDEFLELVPQALVLRGRCLPYGQGITYWPLLQMARTVAGIRDEHSSGEAVARLEGLLEVEPDGNLVARRIAIALGLAAGAVEPEETDQAFQRLFEALAARRPLVLAISNLHDADPRLLALLASLTSYETRVLVLATGRSELSETWSDAPGAFVRLGPLQPAEMESLLDELLGRSAELAPLRTRIHEAAGGNPLFAEELVAMLIDEAVLCRGEHGIDLVGDASEIHVPPSITSMLSVRLELLEPQQRAVLQAGAVEGQLFHRGAAAALLGLESPLALVPSFDALCARGLVESAPAQYSGEAAYRFRHGVVRDAAYGALMKRRRAALHVRFASWLERTAGEHEGEVEEILSFHLEQAARYFVELGRMNERGRGITAAACARLAASARRALARGDAPLARRLCLHALALESAKLPQRELRLLAPSAELIDVPAGTELIREGEMAREFFAIAHGEVEISEGGIAIATAEAGDFFGEIGLLFAGRTTATVTAKVPSRVHVVKAQAFRSVLAGGPAPTGSEQDGETANVYAKDVLVTTDWLAGHLEDAEVVVVEVDENAEVYDEGHIRGAIKLRWKDDLQDAIGRDVVEQAAFEQLVGGRGIGNDTTVVLYGDKNNWFAAYAYWCLKIYGHRDVRLLDGGRQKWIDDGRELTTDAPSHEAKSYSASPRDDSIRVFRDVVLAALADDEIELVDVRSPQEYSGELIAPPGYEQEGASRTGHIPGALSIPWGQALRGDGTIKNADDLRQLYGSNGVTPEKEVHVYCRIGERSAHTWFVLHELLGYKNVKNYDGSWMEWGNLVGLPMER